MTADPDDETGGSISGGPIDFDRLAVIRERFATDDRFTEVDDQLGFAPERLICQYNRQLYAERVRSACLEIIWFENGDFSLHYHETHETGRSITGGTDIRLGTTLVTTSTRDRTHRHRVTIQHTRLTGVTSSRRCFRKLKPGSAASGPGSPVGGLGDRRVGSRVWTRSSPMPGAAVDSTS